MASATAWLMESVRKTLRSLSMHGDWQRSWHAWSKSGAMKQK